MMCRLLLAAVLLVAPAASLYEDQAGKNDWYRQQIGETKHALFHSTGQQRLALVATEPGVLAGVDLRNGQLAWRQVLPPGEAVTSILQHGKGLISVSVSDAGAYVRLWGPMGGLVWDANVPIKLSASVESPEPAVAIVGNNIFVAWQTRVHAYHGGTGELLWEAERSGSQFAALTTAPSDASGATSTAASTQTSSGSPPSPPVHAFSISESSGDLEVTVYEADGKGARAALVAKATSTLGVRGTKPGVAVSVLTLDGTQLVLMDASGTSLVVHELGTNSAHALKLPGLPEGATARLEPTRLPRMVVLALSTGGSLVVELPAKNGVLSLVRAEEGPAGRCVYASTASKEGKAVLALAMLGTGELPLRFETLAVETDGTRGEWAAAESLPYDAEALGPLSAAWLNTYSRKDGSFGHRLLIASSEHSLQLLQTGKDAKVGWVRDEALASVVNAEPVPLPALIAEGETDEARPSFAFVLPVLVDGMKRRLESATAAPLSALGAEPSGPPPTHADAYGFRQAMVTTTQAGKVLALHTSDGSVLWSRRVPAVAEGEGVPKLPFLLICRGGAHPQAVVVAQGTSSWTMHVLSPLTGKPLAVAAPAGPGRVLHAVRLTALAAADGSTRPPVLLVDDAKRVHLYPDTEEVRAGVTSLLGDLFFYLHEPTTGALTGYAVVPSKAGDGFQAVRRWALALPAEGAGHRVRLASFPAGAAVHSPVRVLGDRSVLHKYVNRNLLAVGVEQPGDGDFEEASLLIMLVDTVSGRVVHSITQPGMRGPLTMLLGENWLVCHFWNPKGLSYQMAITELFTNSTVSDDPLTLMLGGAPDYSLRENGFDGFAHAPPHALSQSYLYSSPIEALAVSQTLQGITPKFVLAGTTAGQLVLIDKRFLDPRRPLVPGGPAKMSTADKEEGLVPYSPSLGGINPLTVATHRHTIARPRAITASPTNLESTSLALVVGLDLFMTRVAPAREFDRLNEDFNYVALIFAIIGLTVATYVSGCLSDRKDLKRAWK